MKMHYRVFITTLILFLTMLPRSVYSQDPPEAKGDRENSIILPPMQIEKAKQVSRAFNIIGFWQGALSTSGISLRLVLKVSITPDGVLNAKLDSLDQGAMDLPVDTITLIEKTLRFEMKTIGAAYEGLLNENSTEMVGKWSQGGVSLPLTLKKTDKEVKLNRPQEPKKPYPYDEKEVLYKNKKAGITLTGTLTVPRTKGPFPAVILISGSGAQDRNETIFGHRPFLVLADHLSRQGLAVLRVDDRGVGGSTGSVMDSTTEKLADDVLAGVEYLKRVLRRLIENISVSSATVKEG